MIKLIDLLSILKRKVQHKKISYSYNAVDLIIDYIFKGKSDGLYLDIGAQHPISNNNTYLLFKRGWSGINIDLDKKNIDLFDIARPNDFNLNYAVSSSEGEASLFFYHDKSPINTLNENVSKFQKANIKKKIPIKTFSLNKILESINLKKPIDYMNIDVEGHEDMVLEGFDLNKYKPTVLSIEYLDLKMKKLEFRNNDINNLMESNFYKYLTKNDYFFVNWLHGDLIFVHKDFRD